MIVLLDNSYAFQINTKKNINPLAYSSIPIESANERKIYLQTLRKMSASEKFLKVIELSELTKSLFKEGLRKRFPEKSEQEIHELFLKRLEKCHNSNY